MGVTSQAVLPYQGGGTMGRGARRVGCSRLPLFLVPLTRDEREARERYSSRPRATEVLLVHTGTSSSLLTHPPACRVRYTLLLVPSAPMCTYSTAAQYSAPFSTYVVGQQ